MLPLLTMDFEDWPSPSIHTWRNNNAANYKSR
jgi:hypothetical protein